VRIKAFALALAAIALAITPARPAGASSEGINDWSCRPSAEHPRPVILLHGLFGNADSFKDAPQLLPGFCFFAFTYGTPWPGAPWGGMTSHTVSARQIAAFVDQVRLATGAGKVDLVGWSQGALHTLYVPKALQIAGKVGTVVAIAPATHGTTFNGLTTYADATGTRFALDVVAWLFGCAACSEGLTGSAFIRDFTATPIAQPGIDYTIVASRYDTFVTPTDTAFVPEPGVRNLYLQDVCPDDHAGHTDLGTDQAVLGLIKNALERTPTAPVPCPTSPTGAVG
jgi:pimeloyl-ACP methyl ester carboxylesterase